jgi:hypothetical protein
MCAAVETNSIRKAANHTSKLIKTMTRRHIALYLARLRKNRSLIQYGINQISPENINIGSLSGDTEWTKRFLFGLKAKLQPEFNADFHKITGKSFMSVQNRIA